MLHSMRVVAGRHRGSILLAPPGNHTRPITDRVKESLFSILGHRFGTLAELPPFEVLDLFAGSGSLGIEALSRGAGSCVFVEQDRRSSATLRKNLAKLRIGPAARIVNENAWYMRLPSSHTGGFGLIFVDPPYRESEDALRLLDFLSRIAPRLSRDGLLVLRVELDTHVPLAELRAVQCVDERVYGRMRLLLLRRAPEVPGRITAPPVAPAPPTPE
ncbi:MAG: 16S rRNA (guanine(966)-N(2))-methyltransferase RsmD [Phycisphaerae bacterium]